MGGKSGKKRGRNRMQKMIAANDNNYDTYEVNECTYTQNQYEKLQETEN